MLHICNECDLKSCCKERFIEQTGRLCLNRDLNIRLEKEKEFLKNDTKRR